MKLTSKRRIYHRPLEWKEHLVKIQVYIRKHVKCARESDYKSE